LELAKDVKRYDQKMNQLCQANALSQRLAEVPGIGPLTAPIVAADLGEDRHYVNFRRYAASLGIVPRQNSSAGKSTLLGN
jgi:transposase